MPHSSRRDFLQTSALAGAWMLAGRPLFAAADPQNSTTISVLHTTDLHGHILPTVSYDGVPDVGGFARCASQIRAWRKENPNSLTIDVGDVYQGTPVGVGTRGAVMIRCLNALNYDGWVIGNHEFDWGVDPIVDAISKSQMPVLSANMRVMGKPAGQLDELSNPLSRVQPYVMKEVAGYKIAVVGLTTPGLPYWFRPEFLKGFEALDPVEAAKISIQAAKAAGADAILLAVHMGMKMPNDDFANQTREVMKSCPEVTAVMAGHTHKLIENEEHDGVLLTQANYHGLHAGRITLVFDNDSRKLIRRSSETKPMDSMIELDPLVLSLAKSDLEKAETVSSQKVGTVETAFAVKSSQGDPSDVEELIGVAVQKALKKRGIETDGVIHGLFEAKKDFPAGEKTVADVWTVIPYENFLVTAELTPEQLIEITNEVYAEGPRNLMGMKVVTEGSGKKTRVISIAEKDGTPLAPGKRYRIAFNTFDSRSGGQRFMKTRSILEEASVKTTLHDVQTREALIDLFADQKTLSPQKIQAMS